MEVKGEYSDQERLDEIKTDSCRESGSCIKKEQTVAAAVVFLQFVL